MPQTSADHNASPTTGLANEIGKRVPFDLPEQEAYLNILRTQDRLSADFTALFRKFGLSEPLYNALRIVQARGEEGVPSQSIGAEMVTRDPDVTRLCDRLGKAGLIERERSSKDRRVVLIKVTSAGCELLRKIDPRLRDLHKQQLGHLSPEDLATLNALLVKARRKPEPSN